MDNTNKDIELKDDEEEEELSFTYLNRNHKRDFGMFSSKQRNLDFIFSRIWMGYKKINFYTFLTDFQLFCTFVCYEKYLFKLFQCL